MNNNTVDRIARKQAFLGQIKRTKPTIVLRPRASRAKVRFELSTKRPRTTRSVVVYFLSASARSPLNLFVAAAAGVSMVANVVVAQQESNGCSVGIIVNRPNDQRMMTLTVVYLNLIVP